jgi:isocitrate dehydrogenase kinase/phosphatase
MLFSFARAYFMVDMEVPSAYVQFLRSLMPRKPRAEIYNALGLAKQGKTLFYRDFLYHLKHSSDKFRIAPGIKGMVMLVFDLPSFPFVFKLIKDYYPPQKDTTREQIKGKYLLVKQHDRVGRMADTLEYSEVAFPRVRFEDELIAEIEKFAPSQLEISDRDGDGQQEVIIKHLYIERRMIPLNIYLQEAFDTGPIRPARAPADGAQRHRIRQRHQGPGGRQHLPRRHALEELWRHPQRQGGVLRLRRDRIHHRLQLPPRAPPRNEEDEMSGEIWYTVGPHDVFPETFGPFLLGNDAVREVFMKHHADLLDVEFWQAAQGAHPGGPRVRRVPLRPRRRFRTTLPSITVFPFNFRSLPCPLPRPHRHRRRGAHPHGRLPGRLFRPGRARPGRRRHQGRRRARGVAPEL